MQVNKGKLTPLIRRDAAIYAPEATQQSNQILPFGVMEFDVTDIPVGDSVAVDLPLPQGSKVNNYVKLIDGKWQDFRFDGETGAEFLDLNNDGTLDIRLHFKDGARGDDDGIANAMIRDPGAPTILPAENNTPVSNPGTTTTPTAENNTPVSEPGAPTIPQLNVSAQNQGILSLNQDNSNLLFSLASSDRSNENVNEIGVFTVDDENGNIDGIAPNSPDYLAAAFNRATAILSAISDPPQGFDTNFSRLLDFNQGQKLGFYVVSGDSTATVKSELETSGNTSQEVYFSTTNEIQITPGNESGFNINWNDELQLNVLPTTEQLTNDINLQDETQAELIDLRAETGQVNISVTVNREAKYDNLVGFYQVADANGTVIDPVTGERITPDAANRERYAQVALQNRVQGLDLTVANQNTAIFKHALAGGAMYAPFIIANGNLNDIGNKFDKVHFAYMGVNSDRVDHTRLLGNNVFGFEDKVGGGDKDFNDTIVKIDFSKDKL